MVRREKKRLGREERINILVAPTGDNKQVIAT